MGRNDQHADAGRQAGWGDEISEKFAQQLIEVGIAGAGPVKPAAVVADEALAEEGDAEKAIQALVGKSTRLAGASGFASGLGGFVTMIVALPANVASFYVVATRMVAGIAHLRGYDVTREDVRSAVLLALVGADAKEMLGRAGRFTTGPVMGLATRGLPEPALMVLNKAVAFRLISRVGARAIPRFGKLVPVVGGVIGAGLDTMLMKKIAKGAMAAFPATTSGEITQA